MTGKITGTLEDSINTARKAYAHMAEQMKNVEKLMGQMDTKLLVYTVLGLVIYKWIDK